MVSYNEPDYLAIGPYCWGRAKTAREAVKCCVANRPFRWDDVKKDADVRIWVWQLSDKVNEVEVLHDGSFVYRPEKGQPKEDCGVRKVLDLPWARTSTFNQVPLTPSEPLDNK